MRPKSIILIIIALGCGLVASIGISQVLEQQTAAPVPQVEMENIFVALEDIDINEPITPEMIKLEPWPADKIPEGAIRELENVENRRPRSRLFTGEVILEGKLFGSEEDRGASKLIPKGYRVQAIRVTADSAVAGLVLPGDRVDVLVYLQVTNQADRSQRKQMTRTILTNCRVFAVNEQIHRETDAQGNSIAAKTVSLLVTPKQAEILVLASKLGSLSLSLRPPDESGEDEAGTADEATLRELLGETQNADPQQDQKPAPEPAMAKKNPAGNSFLDFLKNSAPPVTTTTSQAMPEPAKPEWTMDLLTPDGVRRFEFGGDEQLPLEVSPGASTPAGGYSNPVPQPTQTTKLPSLPPGTVGQPSSTSSLPEPTSDADMQLPPIKNDDSKPAGSDLDYGPDAA
ncbi:Flp pilus assembly protein CpaB [Blastopirellula marina]|uniref:Flp pilus assembly protein CpaB n=1 Tax=Blastopirellula marina TaxID=124 RepID=A0A2S8GDS5_9BACT|nr:Flp pilus assembly protein CpaB [Blastopirellula marina]PQO42612.1 Flp pilus assembly protein CpaB [Blastopirellula marina]PTL46378.1 Flp pilus assembly protein CpaB [Blastopirellula marina]